MFEAADAVATFCPVLDSNFALLLESLRWARVAEAPKARVDFFGGADFFRGLRRRSGVHGDARNDDQEAIFDTHPCSTVAYAMRVLFFVAVCFETQGSV